MNDPVNYVDWWGLCGENDSINIVRTWLYDVMYFISQNVEDEYDSMLNTKLTGMMNNGKVQFDDVTNRYESVKHNGHSSNTYAFFDPFRNTETNEQRNIIVIDINKTLETGKAELIDTLAHEGWHAVQEDLELISVNKDNELSCYPNIEKIEYDAYFMGTRMYNRYAEQKNLEKKVIVNLNIIEDN